MDVTLSTNPTENTAKSKSTNIIDVNHVKSIKTSEVSRY
jgi:hypothetical protein